MTTDNLIEVMAGELELDVSDLTKHDRHIDLVLKRQLCMYVLWNETDLTLTEIGKMINRSVATVSWGYQSIAKAIKRDYCLKYWYLRLKRRVREANK